MAQKSKTQLGDFRLARVGDYDPQRNKTITQKDVNNQWQYSPSQHKLISHKIDLKLKRELRQQKEPARIVETPSGELQVLKGGKQPSKPQVRTLKTVEGRYTRVSYPSLQKAESDIRAGRFNKYHSIVILIKFKKSSKDKKYKPQKGGEKYASLTARFSPSEPRLVTKKINEVEEKSQNFTVERYIVYASNL